MRLYGEVWPRQKCRGQNPQNRQGRRHPYKAKVRLLFDLQIVFIGFWIAPGAAMYRGVQTQKDKETPLFFYT